MAQMVKRASPGEALAQFLQAEHMGVSLKRRATLRRAFEDIINQHLQSRDCNFSLQMKDYTMPPR